MGKRKDTSTEEEVIVDTGDLQLPSKKHKKHKHKKHKKKKSENEETLVNLEAKSTAIKMAVKTNEEDGEIKISATNMQKPTSQPGSSPKGSAKKKKKGKESGTSSEEERWLDAIESGKLEEVDDELKKIKPKDPKLMTARQRAMLERKENIDKEPGAEQLLALPSGYREKVMTPEMALKAALKSQRRKQQADEKREKDKKKTMERLLRKQESKAGKLSSRGRGMRRQIPLVTYFNTATGVFISLPPGIELPLSPKTAPSPPPVKLCSIQGCNNLKKYSCSKTGVPLCSLECYQKNLAVL